MSLLSNPNTTEYAFWVHNPNAVTHEVLPDIDDRQLTRQKRRRTSPEDQAILEAEFLLDTKPDRFARKRIVERVGLEDKQIQIWFQNRRQNTRRRNVRFPHLIPAGNSHLRIEEDASPESSSSSCSETEQDSPDGHKKLTLCTSQACHETSQDCTSAVMPSQIKTEQGLGMDDNLQASRSSTRSLKRSLSGFRLSLTSNGSAKISQENEVSPSPPKPQAKFVMSKFRRSHSLTSAGNRIAPLPKGRSRDSRAWEFWCDNDPCTALMRKADQERTGCAAEAIGLMRSNSSGTLISNVNGGKLFSIDNVNRLDDPSKLRSRPTIERTRSSLPRLQKCHSSTFPIFEEVPRAGDKKTTMSHGRRNSTGFDSDKENIDPDGNSVHIRPAGKAVVVELGVSHRRVLGEHQPERKRQNFQRSNKCRHKPTETSAQFIDPENDQELAGFMGKKQKESNITIDDENCVQGLLSLSQGNWK